LLPDRGHKQAPVKMHWAQMHDLILRALLVHCFSAAAIGKNLLPPVNWRWVKEGDGYVRHEAWLHTSTVCSMQ
jgi:hypothetical protein